MTCIGKKVIISVFSLLLLTIAVTSSQDNRNDFDTLEKKRSILQDASVQAARKEIEITVRSVNITNFPEIKIFIEAYNKLGEPLDSLSPDNMYIYEGGIQKKVLKVEKIPVSQEVMVDFVFVIDKTGSMQKYINAVRKNISGFTQTLIRRGIDYRIGLVLFSDDIGPVFQPTNNLTDFLGWLSGVKAMGGGDEKENALEALEAVAEQMKFRTGADRVAVLITDAPYHQVGEDGYGVTNHTTNSLIEELQLSEVRVFSIVPPRLENYNLISRKTRGNYFDVDYPFSTILDNFSNQLTNLFAMTYRTDKSAVPDSIEIALFNKLQGKLVRRTIPIVELGRKLIIENLLYQSGSFEIPGNVPELNILVDFLVDKSNVIVMIEGHTDSVGSHPFNDRLSLLRANSVKQYLVNKGIDANRIKTVGYGERKPIADNTSDFGRKLNRRTEIVIIAK